MVLVAAAAAGAAVAAGATHRRTSPLPASVLVPPAHPRASGVRAAMRGWRDITPAAPYDPLVRPIDYGADATGATDSTAAFEAAVAACLARNSTAHVLSFGVYDLGGVTMDLLGGTYVSRSILSRWVVVRRGVELRVLFCAFDLLLH
jgi:hypothetical protein